MRISGWRIVATMALLVAISCRETGRVDAATLEQTATGPALRVTILGASTDPRLPAIREAIAHWNSELRRLGRGVQLDSGTIRSKSVPDDVLQAASGEVMIGFGPATSRLRTSLTGVPGDIVIALSDTNVISFGMPWQTERQGVVAIKRGDLPPLTLPNVLRNVVVHEIGHALGLAHNGDSTTLMCGRPASCRPTAFVSDRARFFPLTASDEQWLRERWP